MLRAGDTYVAGNQKATVCAFLPFCTAFAGVTAAHVFRYAGTEELVAGIFRSRVFKVRREYDLAYFRVSEAEATPMGEPRYGSATLVSAFGKRPCRVSDISWSLAMVVLAPGDLPGPGESGAPLFQGDKVVGMLSSINLNTCKGTVVSSGLIERGLAEG